MTRFFLRTTTSPIGSPSCPKTRTRTQDPRFYESKGSHDDPLLAHPTERASTFSSSSPESSPRFLTVGRPSKGPRNISYPRRSPNADDSEPRKHGVHYFGAYASRSRVPRKKRGFSVHSLGDNNKNSKSEPEPEFSPKKTRRSLRKSWGRLITRVYQVDPLKCEGGGTLRVVGFFTEHKVIRKILDHLDKRNRNARAPPYH